MVDRVDREAPLLGTEEDARLVRALLQALDEPGRARLRSELLARVAGPPAVVARWIDRLADRGVLAATPDGGGDARIELPPEALAAIEPELARWLAEPPTPAPAPAPGPAPAPAPGPAGDVVRRVALPSRATRPAALTGSERRLLAVVLLGGGDAGDDPGPALARAIRPYGGRLERRADGTRLVMIEAAGHAATDQAARAARCALAVRAAAGDRPVAIAMTRADARSPRPEDDAIERAARLLAHAAGGVALDEVSAGLLDARFETSAGAAAPLLRGERAPAAGPRTLLGRPTPCVGRERELDTLAALFDECIEEPAARGVIVTAAAGMGKSRLAAELVARVQQRGEVAIWIGRGDSLRAGSTFDLLAQALRGALGVREDTPPPERQARIRTRVAEHVPPGEQARVAEFLGELVGAPFDGEASTALKAARHDPRLMSEQMRRAWLDFLGAEAAARPILLVLEDLHWGDFGTAQFLDAALREQPRRPWMLLALARPELHEVFPRLWSERTNVQELRLKSLGRKAGERLVREVLGAEVDPGTVERLVERASGNAFYLEELIRAVAEGRAEALPETVLAMVETRLARLPAEARRVLRAASVFGEVCWEGGVVMLLDGALGATAVGEWIDRLIEQELLGARPGGQRAGERELAFRHALLREGAYATLTDEDRRLAHRLAGEWLARRGEAAPLVLAGHFERGGAAARAAELYLRAAQQADHVLDLEDAIACCDLGLACRPPPELRIALLGVRCHAGQGLQRVSMADVEELLRTAPRGSEPWAQGMLSHHFALLIGGRFPELLASVAALREVAPAPGAEGAMAVLLLNALALLDILGQLAQATALEESFRAIVRAMGDDPMGRWWGSFASAMRAAHAHRDLWANLQYCDELQAIAQEIGGESNLLHGRLFGAMARFYLGAFADAARMLEEISATDTVLGMGSALRRFVLAWIYADQGALDRARDLAAALTEAGRAGHNRLEEALGRWAHAEALRRIGDVEGAAREIEAALPLAQPIDRPGVQATLALIRLAQGRAAEAVAAAETSVALLAAMGGAGMFRDAFARLAHAEVLHATGAHDAARRAIAEARDVLLALAERIPEPALRRSFLEVVPENARTLALARAWLGGPA